MTRIYFDNNATTMVEEEVLQEMLPFFCERYGNPASLHWAGREVNSAVDSARAEVAALMGAAAKEIIFTASGSEGDNLAIIGSCEALRSRGNHIITTAVEHPAILDTCRWCERNGYRVTYLPVDQYGMIDLHELEQAIDDSTILLSIMWANNETGTIFPIAEIGKIAQRHGVRFHCDAVQAAGKTEIDVNTIGVDLLTISGHKIGAPKGIGALYVRAGTELCPHIHGGHQEYGLRSGTHNVAGIVGLGVACRLARERLATDVAAIAALRDRLQQGITQRVEHVQVNGHPEQRLPGTLNISVAFVEGEGLLLHLDMHGIAASSGSACSSGSDGASHVLRAMGVEDDLLQSSIRFSLGRHNTAAEVDEVVAVFADVVTRLRTMSPMLMDFNAIDCDAYVECAIEEDHH